MRGSYRPKGKKQYVMPHFIDLVLNAAGNIYFIIRIIITNFVIGRMSSIGFIRDAAFDPRRWLALGQLSSHPYPCYCPAKSEVITKDIHGLKKART
jgi:hypothetical protein